MTREDRSREDSQLSESTLVDHVRRRARVHPERTAFTFLRDGEEEAASLTFGQLDERAQEIGKRLAASLGPDSRVLMLCPGNLEFVVGFLGCLYGGVLPVPTYAPSSRRRVSRMEPLVCDARPSAVLTTARTHARLQDVTAELEPLQGVTWHTTDASGSAAPQAGASRTRGSSDLAYLQYTSGSTASPKGVAVSHSNLLHNISAIAELAGTSEASVIVGWTPLFHDMGLIANVLHSVYVGVHCVLMTPGAFLQQPSRWLAAITRYRARVSGGPNFAFDLCAQRLQSQAKEGLDLSSWQVAFNSSEPIRASTLERFYEAFGDYGFRKEAFLPCYGLAEATLLVTGSDPGQPPCVRSLAAEDLERGNVRPALPGERQRDIVSCGRPVSGTEVQVVDPQSCSPVAEGTLGEVWVRSPSVSAGYWKLPEATAEAFGALLAGSESDNEPGFLRTGDLAFLEDGALFVTGRLKDLVIIRGRNYYPQDLEVAAETAHPALRQGCSAAFMVEVEGRERLALVAELNRGVRDGFESIVAAVRGELILDHEVQVFDVVFVRPGSIPKTSSGKIRRSETRRAYLADELAVLYRARLSQGTLAESDPLTLPPGMLASMDYEARLDLIRSFLRDRLGKILRIPADNISGDEPLVSFGVDSLATAELAADVERGLHVSVALSEMFESQSLEALARLIERSLSQEYRATESLQAGIWSGPHRPLSYGEERLWFLYQMDPSSTAYYLSSQLTLRGDLRVDDLERSLSEIVRRHEPLRTVYKRVDETPQSTVLAPRAVPVPLVDLGKLAPEVREQERRRLNQRESNRVFDLESGPLLRTLLLRLTPNKHRLLVSIHHIAADGWSVRLFLEELASSYEAFREGKALSLLEPTFRYADFAVWQQQVLVGERLETELSYWREHLSGAPEVLELPLDRPRPGIPQYRTGVRGVTIAPEARASLEALAAADGATLFALLLAVFAGLLSRYSGARDLVIGSPSAGRSPETEDLIGFFVNILPLRIPTDGRPSVRELLARSLSAVLGALDHKILPFEKIVEELQPERSFQRSPIFQVTLSLETLPFEAGRRSLPGLELELHRESHTNRAFDLQVSVLPVEDRLEVFLNYAPDLFDATTIERMARHYRRLLSSAVEASALPFDTLAMLEPQESSQLVQQWNDTETPFPSRQTVHELFEEVARRRPEATSLVCGDKRLTYGELELRSRILAHRLLGLGVGPEVSVAIRLAPSFELVIALLATLRAGGVYVPVDPAYPIDRQRLMVEDSGALVMIDADPRDSEFGEGITWIAPVGFETEEADVAPLGPQVLARPENLAYIIFTSGSTGRPKGVAVPHLGVVRLVREANYLRIGPPDRCALIAAISFDAATFELWGALLNGASLVIASVEERRSPQALLNLLARSRLTTMFLTTALFHQIAKEEPSAFGSLDALLVGGDTVNVDRVHRVLEAGAPGKLLNAYGPTEATTFATTHRFQKLQPDQLAAPIGRPISNTRAYVVDTQLEPVPISVPGELLLGGPGLARGYIGWPARTAEVFIPDGVSSLAGERLYRTSDLVRQRTDGVLDFLGRRDHQVKVRGFRIELGEIEAALASQPEISDGVVILREDTPGERQLVAYVVPQDPSEGLTTETVRTRLAAKLPAYMVPASVVSLETLPFIASGKIDRRALLSSLEVLEEHPVPPRAETEVALAEIWKEVLVLPTVGAQDSFFELGGHSLVATQVISRIRSRFAVEIPIRNIFDHPTLARLAQAIDEAVRARPPLVALPRPADAFFPVTPAQERLWFFEQLTPGTSTYHIPAAFRLGGSLEIAHLRRAFGDLAARHETLRTKFQPRRGSAEQFVAPARAADDWPLALIDLTHLDPETRSVLARELRHREARMPFDFESGGLIRTLLLQLGLNQYELCLVFHHLIADGWSAGVFFRELSELYRARRAGEAPNLPALPVQFVDFAVWQRNSLTGEVLERELSFWRQWLPLPEETLELPTDRPRPKRPTYRGGLWHFEISEPGLTKLDLLCREEAATRFMGLSAVFLALLARYSNSTELRLGTPVAGRLRTEIEGLIGFFVQTLILKAAADPWRSFRDLLGEVRRNCLILFERQDLPFEIIAKEIGDSKSQPVSSLVQVLFALHGEGADAFDLEGLEHRRLPLSTGTAKFDLSLALTPQGDHLSGEIEYSLDLFDATTAGRITRHFKTLLGSVTADPHQPLGYLELLSRPEQAQILQEWNHAPTPPPAEGYESDLQGARLLHTPFERWTARRPNDIALTWMGPEDSDALSYGDLDDRASRLATCLRDLGVGPDELVGVCVDRGPLLVVSLLAILKAGGAYLPLDPQYPSERLAFMAEDSGARVFVVDEVTGREKLHLLEAEGRARTIQQVDPAQWTRYSPLATPSEATAQNLAYLLYTSGSTGRPKGVALAHRGALALVDWAATVWTPQERRSVLATTSISFDLSVYEIFFTLAAGGRIVLVDNALDLMRDHPADSRPAIRSEIKDVTLVNSVPCVAAELSRAGALPASLRSINLAGEALSRSSANQLFRQGATGTRVCNLYGPTEATTYATFAFVDPRGDGEPPIGRPVAGTRAYVLDSRMMPVPAGVTGHLHLASAGLARGYLRRPALTAERFCPNPFAGRDGTVTGSRVYQTGDLVRQRADGELFFVGRTDHQIKIRGFRIELGEIEAALSEIPEVRHAVVLAVKAHSRSAGRTRLVAYVVAEPQGGLTPLRLRRALAERLPAYMVPEAFVFLAELPLTPNGKLDRRALPPPGEEAFEVAIDLLEPRNPLEEVVVATFSEILGTPQVGVRSDFFALGGDSILSLRLTARLQERLEIPLRPTDIFKEPTPAGLARRLAASVPDEEDLEFEPRRPGSPIPASFSQKRLWLLDGLLPDPTAYTIAGALSLQGFLRPTLLQQAVRGLIDRHEVLRTTFETQNEQPFQVIHPPGSSFELPCVDLGGLHSEEQERAWKTLVSRGARKRFDLAQGPLLRLVLARRADRDLLLLAFFHHIVADARSVEIFREELTALYAAGRRGVQASLAPLDIGYAEFSLRQHRRLQTPAYRRQLETWLERLASTPPLLELPTDRPRPRGLSSRGTSRRLPLNRDAAEDLGALARRERASLFTGLLAVFSALLHRYTGADDLVVGVPVTGRTHPKTEPLIGYFDNTLALRSRSSRSLSFREFLGQTRQVALEAFATSEVPLDEIVSRLRPDRDPSHPTLVQVLFSVQEDPAKSWNLDDLEAETLPLEPLTSRLDLSVAFLLRPDAVDLYAEFSSDLFDGSTIERFLGHLAHLLRSAADDPDAQLVALPILAEVERGQLLHRWNRSQGRYPRASGVSELVQRRARLAPQALAIEAGDGNLTYSQLLEGALCLAAELRKRGAGPETRVVVHARRSAALVLGQLAAWTAGAAFVPIDPDDPPQRKKELVAQARPVVILGQLGLEEIPGSITLPIEASLGPSSRGSEEEAAFVPGSHGGPDRLAYVTFTSGAGGRPKGVELVHQGLLNLIFWHLETYDLRPSDRAALIASPAFDASIWEIWPHLVAGASLHVPDENTRLDPELLPSWIEDRGITRIFLPTPLAELVLAEPTAPDLPLTTLLTGGDRLHRRPLPGQAFELFNHYGPTESTVVSTAARVQPYDSRTTQLLPAIGRPIANVQTYVLDALLEPVPIGVSGELYLGGIGLARGYLHEPARTALSFVPDPLGRRPGSRLYRTGDVVRYRRERSLEFLYRRDHQVQIRGFRVELQGIEAVLAEHPAVKEATVLAIKQGPRRTELVAFVALAEPMGTDPRFLRPVLVEKLPHYMVPSSLEIIEAIPRSTSDKIDRQKLEAQYRKILRSAEPIPPSSQTEEILVRIWPRVLEDADNTEGLQGVRDNFFHLGGDSLTAMQVASRASEIFGRDITGQTLQRYPTVEDMATYLDGGVELAMAQAQGSLGAAPDTPPRDANPKSPTRGPAGGGRPSQRSTDSPPPAEAPALRHVNVWLEDEPPWILDFWYRLGVDIGALRKGAFLGSPFQEPSWGDRKELELSLSLAGEGVDIEASPQRTVLSKSGSIDPLYFRLRPLRTGSLDVYLSIYLHREMTLLMRMEITLEVAASGESLP